MLRCPRCFAEIRERFMGELSTHTHECPHPIKTLCTKCWSKEAPKSGRLRRTRSFPLQ